MSEILLLLLIIFTLSASLWPFYILKRQAWYIVLTKPIGIWSITFILYWVLGSLIAIFSEIAFDRYSGDLSFIIQAQLYILMGAICLVLGYSSINAIHYSNAPTERLIIQWSNRAVALLLLVFTFLAVIYIPSSGKDYGDTGAFNEQVYFVAFTLTQCIAWVVMFEKNRPKWLFGLTVFLIVIGFFSTVFQGSRSAAVYYFIPGLIVAVRLRGYKPKKLNLLIALALISLSLYIAQIVRVTYGVGTVRDRAEISLTSFVSSIFAGVFDPVTQSVAWDGLEYTISTNRLVGVDNMAAAIELHESSSHWSFMWGESIWTGFASILLPRFIFPEKPAKVTAEDYFNSGQGIGYDAYTNADTLTNAPFEFYVNFGLPGILIGMFFLGLVWRKLEISFVDRSAYSTAYWVCYLVLCQSILRSEQEMAIYLFATLRIILFVLVIDYFLTYLVRPRRNAFYDNYSS